MTLDALGPFGMARAVGGVALLAVGLVALIGGALGLLRLPDFYTRLHGFVTADGAGAALVAFGLAALSADPRLAVKLLLLGVLAAWLAPISAHLLANAAHGAGLAPAARGGASEGGEP